MMTTEHPDNSPGHNTRFINSGMTIPFILLVCCFAAWGMAGDMTAPLVKVFRSVFSMTNLESSLVQFAYYGSYFCLAIPAAFINNKIGYKGGVLIGLSLAACGGLLFIPAAHMMTYGAFLAALFTLAGGLSILETSANPFVMVMGPERNATRRLNFAQAFNPVGSNLGVLIATLFILPHVHPVTAAERVTMSEQQLLDIQRGELEAVMGPYVGLSILYILLALGISRIKLTERDEDPPRGVRKGRLHRLYSNRGYRFGVIAQFFNIAAQTCIWTYTLHYVTDALEVSDMVAGYWLQASLITFLIMRFVMVGLMGRIDARKLLLTMCVLGLCLVLFAMISVNVAGAIAIVLLSGCISLLFPTIYGEALRGLGSDTKFGAAGLVMAIIGGAIMPMVQGWVMDRTSASFSYVVVAICFAVVASYGWYTLHSRGDTQFIG